MIVLLLFCDLRTPRTLRNEILMLRERAQAVAFRMSIFARTAVVMLPCLLLAGCRSGGAQHSKPEDGGVTDIAVTNHEIQSGVKRLGMNLGGQNYYDSGQMLKNLVFINPGFEGETWQSILRCEAVTSTTCTDGNQWTQWPENFLRGAQYEVISGKAAGAVGTVISSAKADSTLVDQGVEITFAPMSVVPDVGDFVVVRRSIPGDSGAGWWTNVAGGGSLATEFKDLSPETPGKQALKMMAARAGESAGVSSYFDSMAGHSFVQLKGEYRLSLRAKGVGGNNRVHVDLKRQVEHGPEQFLSKDVVLGSTWRDYSFSFTAAEDGREVGTVGLTFEANGADVLLDDVSLVPVGVSRENPTAFRDEVVETLRELRPGILRYHDGDHLGSSIDNLIASPFARVRAGYSERSSQQDAVPLGLHEFLQLCQTVGAEPWFNMPAAMSPGEAKSLIEYLAGASSTPYGAKRAAWGQVAPWTAVFPKIHLELGNEEWNGTTFAGSAMPDPVAYGQRAKQIFLAARSTPAYQADKFDLVIGTFVLMPDWTQKELANSGGYDSTAIAPYLFGRFDDASSDEAIFGPMFAQPEMLDSVPSGYVYKQAKVARAAARSANLSVYETNIGAASGSANQAAFEKAIPSIGAGLTVVDHMLLMMRDLGVKNESIWELPGDFNGFQNSADQTQEKTPLYGVVVDMGGATNLRRPQYLAEMLANEAILPEMMETRLSGANPTWTQKKSANDDIQLDKAHYLQTFAFADGARRSLVVLNLSRTKGLPITFSGVGAPSGVVQVSRLTAGSITDTNETQSKVVVVKSLVVGSAPMVVPAFSMTVLEWVAR